MINTLVHALCVCVRARLRMGTHADSSTHEIKSTLYFIFTLPKLCLCWNILVHNPIVTSEGAQVARLQYSTPGFLTNSPKKSLNRELPLSERGQQLANRGLIVPFKK